MHSLNIPLARAEALMEAISLHGKFPPLFVFPSTLQREKKCFFAFDRKGGEGENMRTKETYLFPPG